MDETATRSSSARCVEVDEEQADDVSAVRQVYRVPTRPVRLTEEEEGASTLQVVTFEALEVNSRVQVHLSTTITVPANQIRPLELVGELLRAAKRGDTDYVRFLVKEMRVDVDARYYEATALHKAAEEGRLQTVVCLIRELGADVDAVATYSRSFTPLHFAAEKGHIEVMSALVYHEKSSETPPLPSFSTAASALTGGTSDSDSGVNHTYSTAKRRINARDAAGDTPLVTSVNWGQTEAVRWFLQQNEIIDITSANNDGWSCLHAAAAASKRLMARGLEITKLLLDLNSSLMSSFKEGGATSVGCRSGLLLVNGRTKSLKTPLHFATYKKSASTARLLLDFGADVNAMDYEGNTPLHFAARQSENRADMMRLLVELCGADVCVRNAEGLTPLHFSKKMRRSEEIDLLVANGAESS